MHITVHLGLLALVALFAFLTGIVFRFLQVKYLRHQVLELEKEKMQDHAEILQLQRKLAEKQERLAASAATPVVLLKDKESVQPEVPLSKRATQ